MAVTIAERWSARKISRGTNRFAQAEYVITGTDSDTAAADALDTYLTTNSLLLKFCKIEKLESKWSI
jgi:ribosomal protein S6